MRSRQQKLSRGRSRHPIYTDVFIMVDKHLTDVLLLSIVVAALITVVIVGVWSGPLGLARLPNLDGLLTAHADR